jgi:hypothetical protein
METTIGDHCSDVACRAAPVATFIHHYQTACLGNGFENGILVEWNERSRINHLRLDTTRPQRLGGAKGMAWVEACQAAAKA